MAGTTPLGTTLHIDTEDTNHEVADLQDISFSAGGIEAIDITSLKDTTRKNVPGFINLGTISATANFVDTEFAAAIAEAAGSTLKYKVTFNDTAGSSGSTWDGYGIMDHPSFSVSSGSAVSMSFTITQTQQWQFAIAT